MNEQLVEALISPLTFFIRRDQMNAGVHCSWIRWSPVTMRLARTVFSAGYTKEEYFAFNEVQPSDVGSHPLGRNAYIGTIWLELWKESLNLQLLDEDIWPVGFVFAESALPVEDTA